MKNTETGNRLSGRAIGSIFFAGFGALWLLLSLYVREQLGVVPVSSALLGTLVLVLMALSLMRQAKRWPRVPDDLAVGRAYGWINAIQWVAVFAAAFALDRLHLDAYILCAITAIVGLHMFPLARLFRYRPHHATGALLVAWAAERGLRSRRAPAGHFGLRERDDSVAQRDRRTGRWTEGAALA